jgi:hypothetical protein
MINLGQERIESRHSADHGVEILWNADALKDHRKGVPR